jgi:septal ring factor EnvC (AmiA/AmiB activator)
MMITPDELNVVWSFVGKLGAGLAVIVALVKGFEYLMSKMPVSKLEERVKSIEEHDKKDLEHFKEIESRIETIERQLNESNNKITRIDEGIQRLGKSQILLLRHFATGNGQKEMADEADDLTEYFINRR